MVKKGPTYEEVVAAIKAILGAGKTPTVRAVREIVGGSNATVHHCIQRWQGTEATVTLPKSM